MTARAEQWERGFAHLEQFVERTGSARVPVKFKTGDGYPLGQWVNTQRKARVVMDDERVLRLEALAGWTWLAYVSRWEEGFAHLQAYVERTGDAQVPSRFKTADGYPLGAWVHTQRHRAAMPPERGARLEALTGWAWRAPQEDKWEEGLAHLKNYAEQHGDGRVAHSQRTSDGYALGRWVNTQRTDRAVMPRDRVERLEAVAGWTWNTYDSRWEEGFSQLKAFVERTGHAEMSTSFRSADGYPLGTWVRGQRWNWASMSAERRERLEALPGWAWHAT